MRNEGHDIYTVGGLNRYIREMLDADRTLRQILVRGEVSNCKYHSSGHIYFTLKDAVSSLPCVMFAGNRSGLTFRLTAGMQVIVTGNVSVYERDGRYQLYARRIDQAGIGLLYRQYEELKKKLSAQGYFAPEHKKPIPMYPKSVGIVTARTGAAIQDIINISLRRNPFVQLVLYPAAVQGQEAPAAIVRGIETLDAYGVDTIIVGRGGGSMEDLWAFNEEIVADAIYRCRTPVISAVGHETDVTIADFTADLRAPTPSAAAELAVPDVRAILVRIDQLRGRLDQLFAAKITMSRQQTEQYRLQLVHHSPKSQIREQKMRLLDLEERLTRAADAILMRKKHLRDLYLEKLDGLSPLARMADGYACVTDSRGQVIRSVREVRSGQMLTISLLDGDIYAKALETDLKDRRQTNMEGE